MTNQFDILNVSKKLPIVIVAAPRTGSTALLKKIVHEYKLKQIVEPYMPIKEIANLQAGKQAGVIADRKTLSACLLENDNNFVLKLMVGEISYNTPYPKLLSSDCYKIKLLRRAVDKQIASLYIATETARYHQTNIDHIHDFELPIKTYPIINCIETICHANFVCHNLPYNFDETVFYEDLGIIENANHANGSHLVVTTKPKNYEEILFHINHLLKSIQPWV